MITYSVQHILILRLLIQFPGSSYKHLQYMLFLASAQNINRHNLGFYDFIRTKKGVFSETVFRILQDFISHRLVLPKDHQVTNEGLDIYYALAGLLKFFDDYPDRCTRIWYQSEENLAGLESLVYNNLTFRKAKPGRKIFKEDFAENILD